MKIVQFYFKLIFILSFICLGYTAKGQYGWVKHYGAQDSSSYFHDVTATQDGGYFIAGFIGENTTIGSNGATHHPLLIRLDIDGEVVWQRTYKTLNATEIWAVKELPNGGAIFILGKRDLEVVATTPTGNIDWIQTYAGSPTVTLGAYASCGIEATSDGNFVLHDSYSSVFKITPSGTLLWTAEAFNTSISTGYLNLSPHGHNIVEVGADSFVVIGGEEVGTATGIMEMTAFLIDGTGVLKREVLMPSDMEGICAIKTNDESLLFLGNADVSANDTLVLIKTDSELNTIWTKKHLLSTIPIDVWDIQELDNGEIWCVASNNYGGGAPTFVFIYVFDTNGDYIKTINLSADIQTGNIAYETFGQIVLSIMNPRVKLIKSGDGHMALGISVYDDPLEYDLGLIKMDTLGQIKPTLEGNIFGDYNTDCNFNAGDISMAGWLVEATRVSDGQVFSGTSDTNGHYSIVIDSGTFVVETASLALAYWHPCVPNTQVVFNGQPLDTIDFAMQPISPCPLVQVDISAPFLRMTGGGSNYTISACNLGTVASPSTMVEVSIDPSLNVLNTSIPIASQSGNVYTFNVGNVPVGACEIITVQVMVDTSAQLGQTHCSEAHVYPDSVCLPNYWNGVVLEVDGNCMNDTVFFEITNTGANMANSLEYYVFEDHVMMRQGTVQLPNGITEVVRQPALSGKTYRLSAEQAVGFPPLIGDVLATKVIEGCVPNSNGSFNTGFVNQFSNGFSSPFVAIDCQPNIASYDPNDKSAQPEGYQSQHYIDTATAIDYKIRFQNTGTDTAFLVVIRDTLSPYVDPSSIQLGASSHPYTWQLLNGGVLKVTFSGINLVDSNTNESLSHGFFRYRINQQPNNPIETVINNRAAIYFDFNPPILTNTTFHTIGEAFVTIMLSTDEIYEKNVDVKVYPNPFYDVTNIVVKRTDYDKLTLELYDLSGKSLKVIQAEGGTSLKLYRGDLPQGMYIYQLSGDGKRLRTGKIVVQTN